MKPFVIQCTTCRARLKVQDESAIGGIYACPKCGSMVQVLPSAEQAEPSAKPRAAAAAPASAAATAAAAHVTPSASAPAHASASVPSPSAPAAAAAASAAAPAPVVPPPLPRGGVATTAAPASIELAPAAPAPSGVASLYSNALGYVRQEAWMFGGAIAAGVAIGASVWLAMLWMRPAEVSATMPATTESLSASAKAPADAPPRESASEADAVPNPATLEERATKDMEQAREDAEPNALETEQADEPAPVEAAGEATVAVDTAEAAAENSDAAVAETATSAAPVEAAPAKPQTVAPAPAAKIEPTGPQVATKLEIDRRLAGPVASVDFRQVPLTKFVAFLAELSTLPIELDVPALKAAGKGPETPVTVQMRGTTIGKALETALAASGLTYTVTNGRLVISPAQSR